MLKLINKVKISIEEGVDEWKQMFKFLNLIPLSVVTVLVYGSSVIAQTWPEDNEDNTLETVSPSANPLLFPTAPEEVNVEEVTPISLERALEIGLRNNRALQIAREELEKTRAELSAAQAALFPNIDFTSQADYSNSAATSIQNIRFGSNRPEETGNVTGTVELTYDIFDGGNRSGNIRRERIRLNSSQLNVETVLEETRFNIVNDYYELQNADAQVSIAQGAVEDANQSLRDAQLREQAGLGTRFDVLQAEVDLANASQELTRAIAEQRTARGKLAETLSLGQTAQLSAGDQIRQVGEWPYTLEDSIVLAFKNRAELESLLLQREIATADKQIALSQMYPTLTFFTNYNFLDDDLGDDISVEDGYAVGGRLRWRLFDGGRSLALARQADQDLAIAETTFAQQRNKIRFEVEAAYYDLISNKDNISTAQTGVVTAEERLRLARLRFQAGVGTQTEVIDAQRDLTQARGNLLQAVIGYNQSLNSLERAVSNLPDNLLFKLP
jgi:OMF family outer membrane factor